MDAHFRCRLLFDMLRIRMIEEAIADRYADQEMRCPVHLSIGQEAVAVGACAALDARDYVMSTHRSHAHYLAKGGSLKAMLAELYGKATGCASGVGGSMHLIDLSVSMLGSSPIVSSSVALAVGAAFGAWLQAEDRVTVAFFGEAATEEGAFFESLNFAALKQLPVVFVCENNLYSVYSPLSVRQPPKRDRVALAQAHGIAAASGYGNDVEMVYSLTQEAVQRARRALGPTYLEFDTYRWREHCGPNYDNHIGYRTEAEFLEWRARCPVERYRSGLLREGVLAEQEIATLAESIQCEVNEAFAYAKSSPFPTRDRLLLSVYADETQP